MVAPLRSGNAIGGSCPVSYWRLALLKCQLAEFLQNNRRAGTFKITQDYDDQRIFISQTDELDQQIFQKESV